MRFEGISVVVPAFNSEQTLEELREQIKSRFCRHIANNFEVIFVNDGSKDKSWEVIKKLVDADSFVRGVNLMRNYGQHNALLAGIRMAKYDIIVTIDDDLQHPPEEIPKLLEKLNEGYRRRLRLTADRAARLVARPRIADYQNGPGKRY